MQGYILGIKKARGEDLLVSVLTERSLKTMDRFYGARHSAINVGYKIDCAGEPIQNRTLLRLRDVTHLGFSWLFEREKLSAWQRFCSLLHEHLKDIDEHNGYYYTLLDTLAQKMERGSSKRILVEGYLAMLEHEGRYHPPTRCFFCGETIQKTEAVALVRGFLPAHERCVFTPGFHFQKLSHFFTEKDTIFFEPNEVESLFQIMCQGF